MLLQLNGGNDGLSMVVPHGDDAYGRARAATRIQPNELLALDEYRGLHPALKELRGLWDVGAMAIVEGCGYPGPNRSHFKSYDIWHNADVRGRDTRSGWVGRLAERDGPRRRSGAARLSSLLDTRRTAGAAGQGAQATESPFVRLKVSAAQKAAALRYQTW